ncbi:uncharacterized protein LOC110854138 [Folsomia candida]|uniref:uncharacterized protein LOC110854138 n=1 Tax=Folsomia candida TaxID=158441 RepID=UPI000B8F582F|nr:uncharacterized protein LOC110854138 [Folsomia candida]
MEINVDPHYFHLIESGAKTVEGRCGTERYKNLQPNDFIMFVTDDDNTRLPAKVSLIVKYPSFKDMLTNEGIENCLPGVSDLDEGVKIYRSFPGYAEKEAAFGVIAIRFKLI